MMSGASQDSGSARWESSQASGLVPISDSFLSHFVGGKRDEFTPCLPLGCGCVRMGGGKTPFGTQTVRTDRALLHAIIISKWARLNTLLYLRSPTHQNALLPNTSAGRSDRHGAQFITPPLGLAGSRAATRTPCSLWACKRRRPRDGTT